MTPTAPKLSRDQMTVICDDWWNDILQRQVFQARVHLDGKPTTLRCRHNHKSPKMVAKCLASLADEIGTILDASTGIEERTDGWFLIHYIGENAYGEVVPTTCLFQYFPEKP